MLHDNAFKFPRKGGRGLGEKCQIHTYLKMPFSFAKYHDRFFSQNVRVKSIECVDTKKQGIELWF